MLKTLTAAAFLAAFALATPALAEDKAKPAKMDCAAVKTKAAECKKANATDAACKKAEADLAKCDKPAKKEKKGGC
jgi:hypothetical protein